VTHGLSLSNFFEALNEIGKSKKDFAGYAGTEFIHPILYGVTGMKIPSNESIMLAVKNVREKMGGYFIDALWLAEVLESLNENKSKHFVRDDNFRRMCVGLNQGTNGWALVIGKGASQDIVALTDTLLEKRFRVFMSGETRNIPLNEKIASLGDSETSPIYFAQILIRYALIYGRARAGDSHAISHMIEDHAPGAIFLMGELGSIEHLIVQGMLSVGVPVIALHGDQGLVGAVKISKDVDQMVEDAWKLPNIRVRYVEQETPDLPYRYGTIFAREELKEEDLGLRLGGTAHSFLVVKPSNQIVQDDIVFPKKWEKAQSIGVLVEIGNRDVDEPITLWLETILRNAVNYAQGIKLHSDRNFKTTLNISKDAIAKGFNLEHLGRIIITGLRNEFPFIGNIKVTFLLDDEVDDEYERVLEFIMIRTSKVEEASDESEPCFYGCTRCRSFSLAHACTVTPDRPSQCGSRPWYRVKAQAILAPDSVYNPSQIIEKGECLDPLKGEYEGVNRSTAERTGGRVTKVYFHSIFNYPHTACSCFQNVAFHIPRVDGIGLMNRGYKGEAPDGSTWTILANKIAGRQYNAGAASFSVDYMKSTKFLQGDGGWERVVWITENLKKLAGDAIPTHLRDFLATEEDVKTMEDLVKWTSAKRDVPNHSPEVS
jgi:acetyl-CoA decarbonylase/synthase complex subunit beta